MNGLGIVGRVKKINVLKHVFINVVSLDLITEIVCVCKQLRVAVVLGFHVLVMHGEKLWTSGGGAKCVNLMAHT